MKHTPKERQNQIKKGKILPSDNNSPNIGLTTQEGQNQVEKKGKVLPSDNNSPNRTDYPREAEPGGKKRKGSAFR